jgi:hypothetical protein
MEFMLGIGPEWIHSNAYGVKMNSVGAEVAADFMFWPAKKHRYITLLCRSDLVEDVPCRGDESRDRIRLRD